MYSVEDPAPASDAWRVPGLPDPSELLRAATGGAAFRRRPGVGAQVMGPDDGYIVQYRRGGFIFFHARGATGRGAEPMRPRCF